MRLELGLKLLRLGRKEKWLIKISGRGNPHQEFGLKGLLHQEEQHIQFMEDKEMI